MEDETGPPKKKIKASNCVICNKPLSEGKAIVDPTEQGIRTLLDAAQVRQDAVYEKLSPSHDSILAGTVKTAFHKSCRASYAAKRNVQLAASKTVSEPSPSTSQNQNPDLNKRCLRADTSNFNIRSQCFICGSSYKRSEKLTLI